MKPKLPSRRAAVFAAAAAVIAIVAATAFAHGSGPVKGATYTGKLDANPDETVSFKVSHNGKKVTDFVPSPFFPNGCGAGGPPPTYVSKPAKIKHRKFKAKVMLVTSTGTKLPAGKATGKFLKHGKEKGTMRPSKLPANCTKNFGYTAKAQR